MRRKRRVANFAQKSVRERGRRKVFRRSRRIFGFVIVDAFFGPDHDGRKRADISGYIENRHGEFVSLNEFFDHRFLLETGNEREGFVQS